MLKRLQIFLVLAPLLSKAQNFDKNLVIQNEQRLVKCYQPPGFSTANNKSLLIGLTGMPSTNPANAANFRGALSAIADSHGNFLVACPVASASTPAPYTGYFALNPGDSLLLRKVIDSLTVEYGISSSSVYLLGFSANGFSSLVFAMHQFHPFKGIIPFNPALGSNYFDVPGLFLNYQPQSPVCLCSGTADPFHVEALRMKDSLTAHGSNFLYNEIQGIGHTYSFPGFGSEIDKCLNYLDNPTTIQFSNADQYIQIYPNPSNQQFSIESNHGVRLNRVLVRSYMGVLIYNAEYPSVSTLTINTGEFAPGAYIVQIFTSAGAGTYKLEIQR